LKEHYLGWLEGVRPDLLVDYHERYRRAYASTEERNRTHRFGARAHRQASAAGSA